MKYLYSFARLFLMRRIEDMKYMPMISDRKRMTLVVEPLPTLDTAKKNCTENEVRQPNIRRSIQEKSKPHIHMYKN
jgi:hypothetical protein